MCSCPNCELHVLTSRGAQSRLYPHPLPVGDTSGIDRVGVYTRGTDRVGLSIVLAPSDEAGTLWGHLRASADLPRHCERHPCNMFPLSRHRWFRPGLFSEYDWLWRVWGALFRLVLEQPTEEGKRVSSPRLTKADKYFKKTCVGWRWWSYWIRWTGRFV